MFYGVLYVCTLVPFLLLDAAWLTVAGKLLYRPTLGDILLPSLNPAPAVVFYAIFPVGLLIFAVVPAVRTGSLSNALVYGAIFGAIAYATYDLTNYATLRNWTLQITVLDIFWGAFASAVACGCGYLAVTKLSLAP